MAILSPEMNSKDLNALSSLALAHVGDAVYELMTRTMLACQGHNAVTQLHRLTVSRVNAPAQARAAERILPLLDEEETAVFKRGRNAHVNSIPHRATVGEYHTATGLEALFGWLYLQGRAARLEELFAAMTEEV